MSVPGVGSTSGTNTQAPSVANNNGFKPADFMKLLMTQLQNQDPLSPMDPTQFAQQLVQFNSLDQLVAIRQDLDTQNTQLTCHSGNRFEQWDYPPAKYLKRLASTGEDHAVIFNSLVGPECQFHGSFGHLKR